MKANLKKLIIGLVLVCMIIVPCSLIFADSVADSTQSLFTPAPANPLQEDGFGMALFRTFIALGLVLGLVFLAMLGIKRLMSFQSRGRQGVAIHVLGSLMMGPKKGLYIVHIEGRRLVLGVTDHQISLLTELEPGDANLPLQEFKDSPLKSGFQDLLASLTKKHQNEV